VARVEVTPASAEIKRRSSLKLVAKLYDADGRELTDREVAWSTSDARIATVDRTGLVVGVRKGSATITATSEGISATASVKVLP
jgi:uncharacterized protein YjdB